MKHFKKFNLFLLSILLFLNFGISSSCYCSRHKENIGGIVFTLERGKAVQQKLERLKLSLKHRKEENPDIIPPIIIGGRYQSVPHAKKYESHHLISAHFCRAHKDIINVKDAPSVLILKELHKFTGSYGGNSAQYFKKEEKAYSSGGLEAILKLGIADLNKIIDQHYAKYKRVSTPKFTPYKRAEAALQRIDSGAYSQEDLSSFISTPLKAKRSKT